MPRHPHEPVTPTLPFPPMPPAPPCGCTPPRMRPEPFSPGGLPAPHGFDFGRWAREKIGWLLSLVPSEADADNQLADREWVAVQAVGGKADKVAGAAEGNLAALTQDGNLADSGAKPSDFATAEQGAKADTAVQPSDIAGFVDGAGYDAEYGDPPKPTIFLKHGDEVVATVDAADFVIDGMVSDVKIENGNLVITFNTDSGKQPIEIPLTDIFDPDNYYDKTAADGKFVAKEAGKGLSTEDYTTAEKTKLDGIAAGAQVNVIETVKVNGTALTPQDKAINIPVPTLDDAVTKNSSNGVKSSGIWSTIWGALSSLPTGFASLYDWCVSQLAGKVPTSRTVNSKALTNDVTLSADDVGALPAEHEEGRYDLTNIGIDDLNLPSGTYINGETPILSGDVEAPDSSAASGKVADAKATGDALDGKLDKSGGIVTGDLAIGPDSNYSAKFESDPSGTVTLTFYDSIGNTLVIGGGKLFYKRYDWQAGVELFFPSTDGTLALTADLIAKLDATSAAPAWVSGTAYTVNALISYNGVVYQNTSGATIQSATTPDTSGSGWTAKPVSDLFLPLTGGRVWSGFGYEMFIGANGTASAPEDGIWWYDSNGSNFPKCGIQCGSLSGDLMFFSQGATIYLPSTSGALALTAGTGHAGNLAALDASGNPTDSGVKPSDKLDSTSAAPAFSSSSTYAVGKHVTYNGGLYRCTTAVTTAGAWTGSANWTADTMTDPDAVLDVTSQNQLRVVAKDGTVLWAQGYDLASTSSATLACDATNNFTFTDGATSQAFTLPTAPTGKVGDFGLDIDNSANTGAATLTLTGLDTTFSVVVPEGESLNDMLAISAGELARFYISLSTFRVNNLPTWHIVKQVVENGGAQS